MARNAKPAKEPRAARRGRAEAEVVEQPQEGGMGLDDGIILTTFLLLAGALALVVVALNAYPKV